MKITLGLAFISTALIFSLGCNAQKAPEVSKEVYIDKEACPYEGCFYGFWRADEDFPLYEEINSDKIIGYAKKDTNIKALTGEVHTLPDIIEFKSDFKPLADRPYKPNTQIEVLTYEGEGVFKAKYQGKMIDDDFIYCAVSGDGCGKAFARTTSVIQRGERTWWIKIQLKDNTIGWAKETQGKEIPISHADSLSGEPLLKDWDN
jgi:hypothetical protein